MTTKTHRALMTLKATDKRPETPRGTAFAPSSDQEALDLEGLDQAVRIEAVTKPAPQASK